MNTELRHHVALAAGALQWLTQRGFQIGFREGIKAVAMGIVIAALSSRAGTEWLRQLFC